MSRSWWTEPLGQRRRDVADESNEEVLPTPTPEIDALDPFGLESPSLVDGFQFSFGEEMRLVAQGWNAPGIVMHPTGGLVMYIGTIPFPEITRAASVP